MSELKRRLVEMWDWWVYRRAYHSLRRMCDRNAGFAYLIKLHLDGWLKQNPLPPELKRATELFHETQTGHPPDTKKTEP